MVVMRAHAGHLLLEQLLQAIRSAVLFAGKIGDEMSNAPGLGGAVFHRGREPGGLQQLDIVSVISH